MAEDGETKVSTRGRGRPPKVPNFFTLQRFGPSPLPNFKFI